MNDYTHNNSLAHRAQSAKCEALDGTMCVKLSLYKTAKTFTSIYCIPGNVHSPRY